jgi:peptidoglycan/xylan/chitin deacetylase (PgdA/CDA1 family)
LPITFVMYHYIRALEHSRYPEIKGLTCEEFSAQVKWLSRRYTFLAWPELVALRKGERTQAPANSAVLTFDDGYIDHFHTVLPVLHEAGIQGMFFPPAQAVVQRRVLDVNKIHFVLSSVPDKRELIECLREAIASRRDSCSLGCFEDYWSEYAKQSRFDTAEVIFIKRLLQRGLPLPARAEILNELFLRFVGVSEATLAGELYMTLDQLRMMVRCGMYVGSHGYSHQWMDSLPPAEQELEIDRSIDFLSLIGAPTVDWVMSYPYGAANDSLTALLVRRQCAFALTTRVGNCVELQSDPYGLPRMDTNDFPKASG